jgi:hypothetical protein
MLRCEPYFPPVSALDSIGVDERPTAFVTAFECGIIARHLRNTEVSVFPGLNTAGLKEFFRIKIGEALLTEVDIIYKSQPKFCSRGEKIIGFFDCLKWVGLGGFIYH